MARNPNVERIYPLSPMQQGMLFESLLAGDLGIYVTQLVLSLRNLDALKLRSAWEHVFEHHEILRPDLVLKNPTSGQITAKTATRNHTFRGQTMRTSGSANAQIASETWTIRIASFSP